MKWHCLLQSKLTTLCIDAGSYFEVRLSIIFTILILTFFPGYCYSQSPDKAIQPGKTFTYKTVDNIQIKADFFPDADNAQLKPAIIWVHGGALIFGSRKDIPHEQLNFYTKAGYSVISIDYRLAPETKLPEIARDVGDAIQWLHKHGGDTLGIDPQRIFIVGHSGGAYLALTSGYLSEFKPRAIVSFYGYGDILDEWYNSPDAYYLSHTLVSPEKAQKAIRDSIITYAAVKERIDLYYYARQKGHLAIFGYRP